MGGVIFHPSLLGRYMAQSGARSGAGESPPGVQDEQEAGGQKGDEPKGGEPKGDEQTADEQRADEPERDKRKAGEQKGDEQTADEQEAGPDSGEFSDLSDG